MPGPEPASEVKLVSRGRGEGAMLTLAESQLREAGIELESFHDDERPVTVRRSVFDTDRPTMRLRFKQPDADD